jgi:hypothetical protein
MTTREKSSSDPIPPDGEARSVTLRDPLPCPAQDGATRTEQP